MYLFPFCDYKISSFGKTKRERGRVERERTSSLKKIYVKDPISTALHTSICKGNALILILRSWQWRTRSDLLSLEDHFPLKHDKLKVHKDFQSDSLYSFPIQMAGQPTIQSTPATAITNSRFF